jgi:hypothetical protein
MATRATARTGADAVQVIYSSLLGVRRVKVGLGIPIAVEYGSNFENGKLVHMFVSIGKC